MTNEETMETTASAAALGAGETLRRSRGLPDQISDIIAEEIRLGRLKPGDRLPTEQRFCEAYGVSRAVIREAISRLKRDGLLVSQQGRGVFVSAEGSSASFRLPDTNLDDPEELRQILELLIAVEVAATALAAERRSKQRSEEHTSELQSRGHLVCRLLLEKNKLQTLL